MSKNDLKQDEDEATTVYLGYIEDDDKICNELSGESNPRIEPSQSTADTLSTEGIAPWSVNKIGGSPIFPYNGVELAELKSVLESMKCKHCKNECVLIFQIESPIDDSPLGRIMQVYACVKDDCIKHSWFTLRCMLRHVDQNVHDKTVDELEPDQLKVQVDPVFGPSIICQDRLYFHPFNVSVIEEPTGRENFAKNNLEALKLASKFSDPDLKPAPIEEKYKNLKNYKPPQPPAHLSDLEDFEKFQLEKLYGNDKVTYRYYKRISRYQAQVVRYDWEGEPLLNSSKIKLAIQPCPTCGAKRKFEFQLMSGMINYLSTDKSSFDKESMDFSSIVVHSCSKNCSVKTFNLEDTFFMPDPDSRIFNKVKQRLLALKLKGAEVGDSLENSGVTPEQDPGGLSTEQAKSVNSAKQKKKNKKRKNKK